MLPTTALHNVARRWENQRWCSRASIQLRNKLLISFAGPDLCPGCLQEFASLGSSIHKLSGLTRGKSNIFTSFISLLMCPVECESADDYRLLCIEKPPQMNRVRDLSPLIDTNSFVLRLVDEN